jgi:hypothetical protein
MQIKRCLLVALLSGAAVCAQSQTPPAAPKAPKQEAYVRRISAGVTLSVLGLSSMGNGSTQASTTTPPMSAAYNTTRAKGYSQWIGYGVTAQASITDHIAVSAGAFLRRMGYTLNSDVYTGVDNPNTVADERTHTVTNENTHARLIDFPVTVRYYTSSRHSPGPRAFFEGGGVLRRVSSVGSSTDTTINDGTTSCCITVAATPAHKSVKGFVGGFGVQLIDPVGIRVIPEVRYTRWMAEPFQAFSTSTRRNQVELMISLSF